MEEEFSSNESGWTKYLGSPSLLEENNSSGIEDGDYNYYQGLDRKSCNGGGVKHKENKDDDSITSDASSGLRKARGAKTGECSSKYKLDDEDEGYYSGKSLAKGDRPSKQAKVAGMVSKAKGALKQKRGKKTN